MPRLLLASSSKWRLQMLRDAGIVTARADAQRRIYRLNEDSLDEIDAWLGKVREFWNQRLDRLERLLNETREGESA